MFGYKTARSVLMLREIPFDNDNRAAEPEHSCFFFSSIWRARLKSRLELYRGFYTDILSASKAA